MLLVKLFNVKEPRVFVNGVDKTIADDGKTLTIVDAAGDPASGKEKIDDCTFPVEKVEKIVLK